MATLRYVANDPGDNVTVFLPDEKRITLIVEGEEDRTVDVTSLTPILIGRGRRILEQRHNRDFAEGKVFAHIDYPEKMRVWSRGERTGQATYLLWLEQGVLDMIFEYAIYVTRMYQMKGIDDIQDAQGRI